MCSKHAMVLIASAQLTENSSDAALQQVNETYGSMEPLYNAGNTSLESLTLYDFDPRIVQECLTLDVVVPKGVWDRRTESRRKNGMYPVCYNSIISFTFTCADLHKKR